MDLCHLSGLLKSSMIFLTHLVYSLPESFPGSQGFFCCSPKLVIENCTETGLCLILFEEGISWFIYNLVQ